MICSPPEKFSAECESLGLAFDPGDIETFGRLLSLVIETNRQFNLTAIRDPDEAWIKHIFDSLTLLPLLTAVEAGRIIDVGAGGGMPGLPLAIALPDVGFTLLEATGKKAAFLKQAAEHLELKNVTVVNDRAENAGQDAKHREQYDVVIARAVGRLPVLLELTIPLTRVGGHVFAIKGEKAAEEITQARQALHRLHCGVAEMKRTPTGTIVMVEKRRKTPGVYPRRPGEPKRNPLR